MVSIGSIAVRFEVPAGMRRSALGKLPLRSNGLQKFANWSAGSNELHRRSLGKKSGAPAFFSNQVVI
jgi:hypothetical protein